MRRLPLLLTSALLASLVACGGDDGGPTAAPSPSTASPTPSALTKEAWVAAVNALCKQAEAATASLPEDPKTAQEYLEGTKTFLDAQRKAHQEIRALTPPAADAATIETNFLSVRDQQIAAVESVIPGLEAAAAKNDKAAAEKALQEGFQQYEQVTGESAEWAEKYGLADCE